MSAANKAVIRRLVGTVIDTVFGAFYGLGERDRRAAAAACDPFRLGPLVRSRRPCHRRRATADHPRLRRVPA